MTADIAVIGAGPGGLATARWLLSEGFEPTIFEQAPTVGGQGTGLPGLSGVWPTMHTNTSRILTAFSDLEHATDLVYPSGRDIFDYLSRYAEEFRLMSRIRFGARVERLNRDDAGWLVESTRGSERFERVVVATGRFQSPAIPSVLGLDTFAGAAGVITTYQYRDPALYRGKRVLVAGGAISALEIAADIAHFGAGPRRRHPAPAAVRRRSSRPACRQTIECSPGTERSRTSASP
jgi:cation diffusion facilitator CzcD-associated flavoprotein CzcO